MAPDMKHLLGKLAGVDLSDGRPHGMRQSPVPECSNGVEVRDSGDDGSESQYSFRDSHQPRSYRLPLINTANVKVRKITELSASASTSGYTSDSESLTASTVSASTPFQTEYRALTHIPQDLVANVRFFPTVPRYGLVFQNFDKEGTHVVNLQFIDCIFEDDICAVCFDECQLMNVTFKRCDFRGFGFTKVVLKNNKFTDCTFPKKGGWLNRQITEFSEYRGATFPSFDGDTVPKELDFEPPKKDADPNNRQPVSKAAFPKLKEYQQRPMSEGQATGWGVPKGSVYDEGEEYVSAPAVLDPQDPAASLRPGLELDHTSSRGLSMKAGRGEHYHLTVFRNCTFENVRIEECYLDSVTFENCTFRNFALTNVVIRNTVYQDCEFGDCEWKNRSILHTEPQHRMRYLQNEIRSSKPKRLLDQAEHARQKASRNEYAMDLLTKGEVAYRNGRRINRKGLDQTAAALKVQDSLEHGEVSEVVAAPEGVPKEKATTFSTPKFF
ncbi:hypothetical protein HII31_12108 [Pseudocercospora fuligena]|uniref:Pentapeptide repeat-containing protein n=1 Tax=Pseudocercospora fuligena TaxID=685502 RepID=A0A8H6VCT6_9PEZI|nr:hypothetical protein HII31_12108 [Pseudocercospora fuligena]